MQYSCNIKYNININKAVFTINVMYLNYSKWSLQQIKIWWSQNFKLSKYIKEIGNYPIDPNVIFTSRNIFSPKRVHVSATYWTAKNPHSLFWQKLPGQFANCRGKTRNTHLISYISDFSYQSWVGFTNWPDISLTGETAALAYIPIQLRRNQRRFYNL